MKNNIAMLGIALLVSNQVFSATSGVLLLKGTVAPLLSIQVLAESIASSLPLDTTQVDTKVATIVEKSNSNTGYKVTINSSNKGRLKRASSSDFFPYALKYDSITLNLATAVVQVHSSAAAVNQSKDLTISYTGVDPETMIAGEYTDNVTFTIAVN